MSLETTTIGELNDGAPLVGTDQFVIERLGGSNFKVDADDIATFVGGGGASPLTTKGDLYTYDTADARLPIGTADQVLTVDAAEATGMKWADPAGGGLDVILDSDIKADSSENTATLTFTTLPFDATTEYIELVCVFSFATNPDQIRVRLNGNTNPEYTSDIRITNQNGDNFGSGSYSVSGDPESLDSSVFALDDSGDSWGSTQEVVDGGEMSILRIRIYMGSGMGGNGPSADFYETCGGPGQIPLRTGRCFYNDTDIINDGISSIDIFSDNTEEFIQNSSFIAYRRLTNFTSQGPATPP